MNLCRRDSFGSGAECPQQHHPRGCSRDLDDFQGKSGGTIKGFKASSQQSRCFNQLFDPRAFLAKTSLVAKVVIY